MIVDLRIKKCNQKQDKDKCQLETGKPLKQHTCYKNDVSNPEVLVNVINECKADEYSCNCLYIKHALDNLVIIFDDEIVSSTINISISKNVFFVLSFPIVSSYIQHCR